MAYLPGRHFLQIPGPTNCPLAVLSAVAMPTIDHRGPDFQVLAKDVLANVRRIFKTTQPVIIYPASGTGAWEAALANTLSPGDTVLMYETGQFSVLWQKLAQRFGLVTDVIAGDWRSGVDVAKVEAKLRADKGGQIKAVCMVHNETSTGTRSDVKGVRDALDRVGHPALLMVDTVSSLASMDFRHDEWGVDVAICGSQKGLMLPPGLGFNAISEKALEANKTAKLPRAFWDWHEILTPNAVGYWPSTPGTNLLQGLKVAIALLDAEGLDNVFARHARVAEATRKCVQHWGLELQCTKPSDYSPSVTTVRVPEGHSADRFRKLVLETYNMSLGSGLGPLVDKVFRIGHIGDFNELTAMGALSGVEMGLTLAGIPHRKGGVEVAMASLLGNRGPTPA